MFHRLDPATKSGCVWYIFFFLIHFSFSFLSAFLFILLLPVLSLIHFLVIPFCLSASPFPILRTPLIQILPISPILLYLWVLSFSSFIPILRISNRYFFPFRQFRSAYPHLRSLSFFLFYELNQFTISYFIQVSQRISLPVSSFLPPCQLSPTLRYFYFANFLTPSVFSSCSVNVFPHYFFYFF